jgi:RNA polymerase-associated protein CTR9
MYHKEGRKAQFHTLLSTALGNDDRRGNPHLFTPSDERIKSLNILALYYHQMSLSESSQDRWK